MGVGCCCWFVSVAGKSGSVVVVAVVVVVRGIFVGATLVGASVVKLWFDQGGVGDTDAMAVPAVVAVGTPSVLGRRFCGDTVPAASISTV